MMFVDSALGQFLWCFHPPIPRISTPLVVVGQSDCRCVPISGRGTPIIIVVTIASLFVCLPITDSATRAHTLFSLV
ncbi:hypothetical protein BDV36DRAFT_249043, partial [Aspergillus pseudocaelatus]